MNNFQKVIDYFDQRYYGDIIVGVFELTSIVIGLLFVKKDKMGVFFLLYLIFDFLALIIYHYIVLFSSIGHEKSTFFIYFMNALVSLTELLIYYHFFFKIIRNKLTIKIMYRFRLVFIVIMVIFIFTQFNFLTDRYSYVSEMIQVVESFFLLLPCFVYFYERFKDEPIMNLYQRPSFWIVAGILFYSAISVPYLLIDRYVSVNRYEYRHLIDLGFFYIPFAINFIFLTKAFLCKKTLTI